MIQTFFSPKFTGFYIVFTSTIIFNLLTNSWFFSGQMWAEMATNYFHFAEFGSWYEKLFATDSGYIPLFQRLIALLAWALHIPYATLPLFYNISGLIFQSLMIASFSLPVFRQLIPSDGYRIVICIILCITGDWETRNFINVSYFSLFPLVCFLLLLIKTKASALPAWTYGLPLLFVTKPIIIISFPFLLAGLFKTTQRSRIILGLSLFAILLQICQLILSRLSGIFIQNTTDLSFALKLKATIVFYFGIITNYITGPTLKSNPLLLIIIGIFIVSYFLYRLRRPHTNAQRLFILSGLVIVFVTIAMNCFIISDHWHYSEFKFKHINLYRHTISIFYGILFLVIGLLSKYETQYFKIAGRKLQKASVYLLLWFFISGWAGLGFQLSLTPPHENITGHSNWKEKAANISHTPDPFVIQLDPKGWQYTVR